MRLRVTSGVFGCFGALPTRRLSRLCTALFVLISGCAGSNATADRTDTTVAATAAPESTSDVRRVVIPDAWTELTIGDPPRRFTAIIERTSGVIDTVAVNTLRSRDSTVARVTDGALVAADVGQSRLSFEVEGVQTQGVTTVRERIFADSVRLSPGEVRAWELRPGWYRITVDATPFPGEPQTLELGAELLCVPEANDRKTIACRVQRNTRIILRHTGVSRRREPALAVVAIYRTPR